MSASISIWIEITDDAGEVEAVCTLAEFRAANPGLSDEEIAEIEALMPLLAGDLPADGVVNPRDGAS